MLNFKNILYLIILRHKRHSKLYLSIFDSIDVNIIDTALLPVLVIPENKS